MVWMKTLFFRESDCGAYDFAARKKTGRRKKNERTFAVPRLPRASQHRDARFLPRGSVPEEGRKKRFDPHPARFDRAGFGAASTPRRV
jgi:hypothetical protein